MAYFVKFVPYNQNTISNLIHKTIWFSTGYELNDLNELPYILPSPLHPDFLPILNQYSERIKKFSFVYELLKYAKEQPYLTEHLKDLEDYIKSGSYIAEIDNKFASNFLRHLVFSSVGIFCVSKTSVFKDDSALLMFAHYADNLKGLALIYEISRELYCIDYGLKNDDSPQDKKSKLYSTEEIQNFIEGKFSSCGDMGNFLMKSKAWSYEQEKRLFAEQGRQKAEKHGVHLKAILHTLRFKEEDVCSLNCINQTYYGNTLKIKKLLPDYRKYMLKVYNNDNPTMTFDEWFFECLGNG